MSNERSYTFFYLPGDAEIHRATYEPGTSGGVIRNQAHFRLFFY